MMKKEGDSYVVLDSTGKKVLGRQPSRKKAAAQIGAIEASKHRRAAEGKPVHWSPAEKRDMHGKGK